MDLAGPGYHINRSNLLVLESEADMQKRGQASPDDEDALALTFAQGVSFGEVAFRLQQTSCSSSTASALRKLRRAPESLPDDPLICGVDVSGGGAAWNVCAFRRGGDASWIPRIRDPRRTHARSWRAGGQAVGDPERQATRS